MYWVLSRGYVTFLGGVNRGELGAAVRGARVGRASSWEHLVALEVVAGGELSAERSHGCGTVSYH